MLVGQFIIFLVHCFNSGMYFTYPNRDLTCPVVSDVIYSISFNSLSILHMVAVPYQLKLACIEEGGAR